MTVYMCMYTYIHIYSVDIYMEAYPVPPEAETQPIDILAVEAVIPENPIYEAATPEKFAEQHAKTKPLPGAAEEALLTCSCACMVS